MNTPAHLIIAAAAFARRDNPKTILPAILGGLAPDFSLYVMSGFCLFILGESPEIVFDQRYFSPAWQQVFAIDNSIILWALVAFIAWRAKSLWVLIFSASALLHILCDLPLHHDDGRAHFWPLTNWIFESPISYWDRRHYGGIVAPIEIALVIGLNFMLWRRFYKSGTKFLSAPVGWSFIAIGALEVVPYIAFGLLFA